MSAELGAVPRISVISPLYRSGATVEELVERVSTALRGEDFEIVLVDDGSPDDTLDRARSCLQSPGVRLLSLTRNSGQHRAVLAGLAASRGRWLVCLDADLQDPPEVIPAMLELAGDKGYEAVFGGRVGLYESWQRHVSSRIFKSVLALVAGSPHNAGMFFVLTGEAFERVRRWDGDGAFVVAMIGLSGVSTGVLPVRRSLRVSGSSSYTARDRWRVGREAIAFALRARWRGAGHGERPDPRFREIEVG